jgi:hypothetical protein
VSGDVEPTPDEPESVVYVDAGHGAITITGAGEADPGRGEGSATIEEAAGE